MNERRAMSAVKHYGRMGAVSGVEDASPHRLIQMLMGGALSRIATAAGHLRRGETASKGEAISLAISIIEGLRASLDHDAGGAIADDLERLYEYMERRLVEGNLDNDPEALEEVHRLLSQIKDAWDRVPARLAAEPRDAEAPALREAGAA